MWEHVKPIYGFARKGLPVEIILALNPILGIDIIPNTGLHFLHSRNKRKPEQVMNLNTSERAAPRCGPATVNVLVATATKSIQAIGAVECADIRKVLDAMIAQMQASGFGLLDVNTLANAADFICGQADYGDSLDAMHDAINGLGLTSRIETARMVGNAERATT